MSSAKKESLKKDGTSANSKSSPPGRLKIEHALLSLLEQKDFNDITASDIAKSANVTDGLLYKYFKNKKDLLYYIVRESLEKYMKRCDYDLKGIKGCLNKLRRIIWVHINAYATNGIYAKALISARHTKEYYSHESYQIEKRWGNMLLNILEEGVINGEIQKDISPKTIRQTIVGCIESTAFVAIMSGGEILPDKLTDDLCEIVFNGIGIRGVSRSR